MRDEARYEKGDVEASKAAWVKDGPVILHLERVNAEFEFGGIYLFRFNDDNSLQSIAHADNSEIDETDRWVLENLRETSFRDDGVQVNNSPRAVESFDVSSEWLGITLVKPISLSARGLLSYIDLPEKKRPGGRPLRGRTLVESVRHRHCCDHANSCVGIRVRIPALGRGGRKRLMIGVLIGLAYFLASEMLTSSGQVFNLNPAVITWVPTIALLLITSRSPSQGFDSQDALTFRLTRLSVKAQSGAREIRSCQLSFSRSIICQRKPIPNGKQRENVAAKNLRLARPKPGLPPSVRFYPQSPRLHA